MNLRDLQYLVSLADHGHFGNAAKESFVSQPTLSMQLKKLETYLGIQLVERQSKKVMLTPIGQDIAERARRILKEANDIKEIAKAAQDPFSGHLRLGAFPTLAPYILPFIVPVIHTHFPKLQLFLTEEKSEELLLQLKSGKLDATLLALPITDDTLQTVFLLNDPFMLAVPENHRLAKEEIIDFKTIENEPLLLLEEGHCLREQALDVCEMAHAYEYQNFRATSMETLRQMVIAGIGITLIPKLAIKNDPGIVYIPFKEPAPSRQLGVVYRKTSPIKPCIEALIALISEHLKNV